MTAVISLWCWSMMNKKDLFNLYCFFLFSIIKSTQVELEIEVWLIIDFIYKKREEIRAGSLLREFILFI